MTVPLGEVVSRQSFPQRAGGPSCSVGQNLTALAPLVVSTALAATLGAGLPRWAWMWSIAIVARSRCAS
jgi:hypothetical protein